MEFDFYELFKNYSTPDLLLILKKPGDYQPEALAAARKLLTDREITAADEAEANARAITGKNKEAGSALVEKADNLLQTVTTPWTTGGLPRWHMFLILFLFLRFLLGLYANWQMVIYLSPFCVFCELRTVHIVALVAILLDILIVYLMYRRKSFGWKLAVGVITVRLISALLSDIAGGSIQLFSVIDGISLLTLLADIGIIVYLWRSDVAAYFNVTPAAKIATLQASIFITAGVIIVLIGFFVGK